jgi:TRAP-type C4-dicarboxylate transport system permease small subunit
MKWLSDLHRLLVGIFNTILVLSVLGLAGTMAVQVFLRYVLQSSFLGVEEISALFGLWLYFAGLPLVTANDQHIRGGFLLSALPPRVSFILNIVFAVACAVICAYFFIISVNYLTFIFEANRRSTFLRWPSFLWAASLSVGLAVASLMFVIRALQPGERS